MPAIGRQSGLLVPIFAYHIFVNAIQNSLIILSKYLNFFGWSNRNYYTCSVG